MILPALPHTGPEATSGPRTPEERSGEDGFALLWAMDEPVQEPVTARNSLPFAAAFDVAETEDKPDGDFAGDTPSVPADTDVPADSLLPQEKPALADRSPLVPAGPGHATLDSTAPEPAPVPAAMSAQGASALQLRDGMLPPLTTGDYATVATVATPATLQQDAQNTAAKRPVVPLPEGFVEIARPTAPVSAEQASPARAATAPQETVKPAAFPDMVPSAALSDTVPSAAPPVAMAAMNALAEAKITPAAPVANEPENTTPRGLFLQTSQGQSLTNAAATSQSRSPATVPPAMPISGGFTVTGPQRSGFVGQGGAIQMRDVMDGAASLKDDPFKGDTGLLPAHAASQAGPMATAPLSAHQTARPTPPPVALQLLDAFVRSEGGRTEIALNPEELGRVRFAMVATDAGMTLAITTERPETADLIRRNLEDLAREFRQMGFENLTFSFDDAPQDEGSDATPRGDPWHIAAEPAAILAEPEVPQKPRTGLDLKL